MPKRKHKGEDYEYISRKIKQLEKKLLRHTKKQNSYSSSSRSSTPQRSQHAESEIMEPVICTSDDEFIISEVIAEPNPSLLRNDNKEPTVDEPQASTSTAQEPEMVVTTKVNNDLDNLELDSSTLALLGEDPTTKNTYGDKIQKDLALRFEHWATVGLTKDLRDQLTTRYLTPNNCTLIDPPILNAEIKAAVSDVVASRDKAIEFKQKQLSIALSAIGEVITKLLSAKERDETLVKTLMDAGRILCDSQHKDSMTRKNFVLCTVKKEMRSQLQNTNIDKYLFSEKLSETIKSAKEINRSCVDLKNNPTSRLRSQVQKTNNNPSTSRNLNWKGPPMARRQPAPGPPRTKTSAPAPARNRQQASSRPSHNPRSRSRR